MKGTIKDTLYKIGLAEKEIEVYLFLGKVGPQKGRYIADKLRMNKGQVYRILQVLQKKGVVETTLEQPKRFLAVPLEKVIDSFLTSKREEVEYIEQTKDELINDWNNIRQIELESSFEKFCVIEGEKKIFQKISQMVKETKKEFLTIASVNGLLTAFRYGIFEEAKTFPLENKIEFRFITQLAKDNLEIIKPLLKSIRTEVNIEGRVPERSSSVFPRVVIKDRNEILLFISNEQKIENALHTNCKSIVESFNGVFQDLWNCSSDIEKRIDEIESCKPISIMELIKNPTIAKTRYFDALDNAKEEILIVTSTKRLIETSKNTDLIKKWCKRGISTKIMAPITYENLKEVQELLSYCEVRHIPVGYFETTIIDGNHLFQFRKSSKQEKAVKIYSFFENTFHSTDKGYIKATRNLLFDIWKKTHSPSNKKIQSIDTSKIVGNKSFVGIPSLSKRTSLTSNLEYVRDKKLIETEVLEKIKTEKEKELNSRNNISDWKQTKRCFGKRGFAVIYPPESLGLPPMKIGVLENNKYSSFGEEKRIIVYLWKDTEKGSFFVPVAFVNDNPNPFLTESIKFTLKGFPAENNILLFNKDDIQIQMNGNTLFAGWTKPIPLGLPELVLPPSCLFFEGYGTIKSDATTATTISGRKLEFWINYYDAFVTYFHPKMKYIGSGTEAYIEKDAVMILSFE